MAVRKYPAMKHEVRCYGTGCITGQAGPAAAWADCMERNGAVHGTCTDIPLTQTGCIQAKDAGKRIREFLAGPGAGASAAFHVYVSPLKRRRIRRSLPALGNTLLTTALPNLDYGPAEGRTRSQVAKAIGEKTWNIWDRGSPYPSFCASGDKA